MKTSAPLRQQVCPPLNCSGPLSQCQARDRKLTEAQWSRGQMRGHAGFWRRRREIAASTGRDLGEITETSLFLAKLYRDEALKLEVLP